MVVKVQSGQFWELECATKLQGSVEINGGVTEDRRRGRKVQRLWGRILKTVSKKKFHATPEQVDRFCL